MEDFCPYATDDPTTNPHCNDPASVEGSLHSAWEAEAKGFDFQHCMDAGTGGDVSYRYQLANGRTLSDPVVQDAAAGEWVRLRMINSAGMSNYKVVFPPNVAATLIAVDGQFVRPVLVATLPGNSADGTANGVWLGVAQRADVMLQMPSADGTYPVFARADGASAPHLQSGIVFRVGTVPVPTYSTIVPEADGVGFMGTPVEAGGRASNGIAQEQAIEAFFPLMPVPTPDFDFEVHLTGDNGFLSINSSSYQLVPWQHDGKVG